MKVTVVLVNPAVPENVGFALRAMNTMGFTDMRIVGNVDLKATGLRKTAYGSHFLIERISTCSTLKEALKDVDLSVGTTAKKRSKRSDAVGAKDLLKAIQLKGSTVQHVALVFGSEENGLSNSELESCDIVSTIPLATEYPSLNLAQSVLIYLWELSNLSNRIDDDYREEAVFETMISKANRIFAELELERSPVFYQRLKDRLALLGDVDTRLILKVLSKLENKLKDD